MRNFHIILLAVFVLIFFFAVLVFAGIIKIGSSNTPGAGGTVALWGTIPVENVEPYINEFNKGKPYSVVYTAIAPDVFTESFIEALASGTGPDLVLVTSSTFLRNKDKLFPVPFTSYSERLYRDTYIDGASVFLNQEGIAAFPLTVDPLVLYYNKDMLARVGIITPPRTWEELNRFLPFFVKRDTAGAITQTALPLGESVNVRYFKKILSNLFLQTGNRIVAEDPLTLRYGAQLDRTIEGGTPAGEALMYYISFANPVNEFYSWNRSLPNSLDMFVAGKAAFYIGTASDLFQIRAQNPNLNFDVTEVPQPEETERPVVFADFTGIATVKASQNFVSAYSAMLELAGVGFSDYLSKTMSIPPARRDLLVLRPDNPYMNVFFGTAVSVFSWPDPDEAKSDDVFRAMITNVSSGRMSPTEAIYEANRALQSLIR